MVLESTTTLLSNMAWPVKKYLTIPLQSGDHLHARLLLPPDLDTEDGVKYPLLLNMYDHEDYPDMMLHQGFSGYQNQEDSSSGTCGRWILSPSWLGA